MLTNNWIDGPQYDAWKTSPPDEGDTKCKCSQCEEELFEGDDYWEFDDEIYCEECAKEWFEEQRHEVTREMARGEE